MVRKALISIDRDGPLSHRLLWHFFGFILPLPVYLIASFFRIDQRLWFPCKFNELTGLPCPTCGFTRSFLWMGHGDYVRAFSTSPFAAGLFLAMLLFMAVNLAGLLLSVQIKPGPFFHWKKKGWVLFFTACLTLLTADWLFRCFHGLH